jgi:hypothetical protein
MMARGLGAGKRLSGILAIQLESLGREPGSVNAKTAFSQNPISPLAGEMSAKQTEGVWFSLFRTRVIWGRLTPLCHLQ